MRGLDPRIHAFPQLFHWKQWLGGAAWITGSSPVMTKREVCVFRVRQTSHPLKARRDNAFQPAPGFKPDSRGSSPAMTKTENAD
jgi:hypothetical protein